VTTGHRTVPSAYENRVPLPRPRRFVPRTFNILLPKAHIRIWRNLWRYPSHATRGRLANFESNSRIIACSRHRRSFSHRRNFVRNNEISYIEIFVEFHIWNYIRILIEMQKTLEWFYMYYWRQRACIFQCLLWRKISRANEYFARTSNVDDEVCKDVNERRPCERLPRWWLLLL